MGGHQLFREVFFRLNRSGGHRDEARRDTLAQLLGERARRQRLVNPQPIGGKARNEPVQLGSVVSNRRRRCPAVDDLLPQIAKLPIVGAFQYEQQFDPPGSSCAGVDVGGVSFGVCRPFLFVAGARFQLLFP